MYILVINKVIKCSSFFTIFLGLFSKGNRKHFLHVSIESMETLMKVWENSKKLWKHSPAASVPTAFLVLPNFHLCFYNLIETWKTFSIS